MSDKNQNSFTLDGVNIATYYSEHMEEVAYLAVNMTKTAERFELTEEEKTNVPELMAGYCGVLEELGYTGVGATELEAVTNLLNNRSL